MKLKKLLTSILFAALSSVMATAGSLEMSAYWQDHMVLQRGKPITVWGKGAAGRTVTVSFAGQQASAVVGTDGFWETTFAQPFAVSTTGQTLTVSDNGGESLTRSDILVGDVYLAGGQSNMDRFLVYKVVFVEPQSIQNFCRNDEGIRYLRIAKTCEKGGTGEEYFDLPPIKPVDDGNKYYGDGHDWAIAKDDDRYYVSSVALNFARYIRDSNSAKGQDIPIGIIHASVGGSYIRNWLSRTTLTANGLAYESGDGWYWDEMIAPILRAKICAILWYQGCSDAGKEAGEYKSLMDILVRDWRGRWGENGDLPFYAVQIGTPGYTIYAKDLDKYPAPTESSSGSNYVRVREGQRLWDDSDTGVHGLVTIVDCVKCLGEGDLHPTDKNFVGRRLSLFARKDLYGETELQTRGPVYTRAVREADGAVRIHFKAGTAKGLTAARMKPATDIELSRWMKSKDEIRGFALCGSDNVWKDAVATVEGETIVLRAEGVSTPTKFHYGYWNLTRSSELEDGQRLNLYNDSELPMSPVAPQTVEDPASSAKVTEPVLTPASCFFSPSTNVTISCATSGATIRYTLDGSEPTEGSDAYASPIAITATTTVKARAYKSGKTASDVVFSTYTLGEAAATEPNPQWTPGAYVPSEWAPIGENLLAGANASYEGSLSYICDKNLAKLSDGLIPVDISGSTGSGSQTEVVGFQENSAAIWEFAAPVSIGKIRISTRWINTSYDAITVNDVYVKKAGDWVALGVPLSHKSGVSTITTGSLEATLADENLGYLAADVTGLKIVFGKPESAVANYYAEIEAIAPGADVPYVPPADDDDDDDDDEEDPPVTPPEEQPEEPTGVSDRQWTASDFNPSAWTALSGNLLAGLTATVADAGKLSFAASKDLTKLTDGKVSATAESTEIVGLCEDAELVWTFNEPKTLEKVRLSSLWTSKIYAGISVKDVLVQPYGSTEWVSLGVSFNRSGNATANSAQYAVLSDPGLGYLALDVVALKIVAGSVEAFANYYGEIEAVGRTSSEGPSYPPSVSGLELKPWGESVEFSGTIVSAGTGATSCDVYLAYGADADHLGSPVKIHSGAPGAFHYELVGLDQSTSYSYLLSVSNNAATAAGCSSDGTFTTTAEVHPDWSGYKWAVIGDSLTDATLPPGEGNYYYDFVAADTGIQLAYVNGVGSTGYKNKSDQNKCFYQRLLTDPLPADIDVVTIFGSVNDWGQVRDESSAGSPSDTLAEGKSTLAAYMNKAIDVIQTQAPDAKIVLVGSLYYYNVLAVAHEWANETLRAVAAARGVTFCDWLTENANDPLDFHHIADNPTAEGSFAQRYARDCPSTIVPGETSFGHPSAEYHEAWLSPHFRAVLTEALTGVPVTPPVTPTYTITITAPANGTLETSVTNEVAEGTRVTVSATPAEGYELKSVTMNGAALSGSSFMMPAADVTLAAVFEEVQSGGGEGGGEEILVSAEWTLDDVAPSAWTPFQNNLLSGKVGSWAGSLSGYASNNLGVLTDGSVPTAAGKDPIVGPQSGTTITWTLDAAKTISRIRVTSCYLADASYSRVTVSKVEFKDADSEDWNAVEVDPVSTTGAAGNVLIAELGPVSGGNCIAKNVIAVRLTFGKPPVGFANYCAEIEAEGLSAGTGPDAELYDITITASENGTLETSVTNEVAAGTRVTVSATPAEGYELKSVTMNGAALSGNTFTMPAADVTLAAVFEETRTGAELAWSTGSLEPSAWQPLADNLLLNVTGASEAQGVSGYASTDLAVLTDGAVPTAAPDKEGIYGFRVNDTISWSFAEPKTLGQIRISSCYLTGAAYDGVHIAKIEVKPAGGAEWVELAGEVEYKGGSSAGKINYAVLSRGDDPVAENVVGLKVTFGTCETGYANYYAEIEASEASSASGPECPEWIDAGDADAVAKYTSWAETNGVADPSAAIKDAFLLNCANTASAVAAAVAAFRIESITVSSEGAVEITVSSGPEGGYNGTVTIQGCATLGGEYHAKQSGDRFFKAVLEL